MAEVKRTYYPSGKLQSEVFDINGKKKTTKFGAVGYEDFTKTRDINKREAYLARHKTRENWDDPTSAGALSRWILWNEPTLSLSIKDFKKRFKL